MKLWGTCQTDPGIDAAVYLSCPPFTLGKQIQQKTATSLITCESERNILPSDRNRISTKPEVFLHGNLIDCSSICVGNDEMIPPKLQSYDDHPSPCKVPSNQLL